MAARLGWPTNAAILPSACPQTSTAGWPCKTTVGATFGRRGRYERQPYYDMLRRWAALGAASQSIALAAACCNDVWQAWHTTVLVQTIAAAGVRLGVYATPRVMLGWAAEWGT